MAHYAFLNENNIVTEVIVGKDEDEDGVNWEEHYANIRGQLCKRTSYNNNIRKNYAGVGYSYRADIDVFIPPQPYASWLLNEDTYLWEPPVPKPDDGQYYRWNEETVSWVAV